ncbi:MAG: hypothetical protein GY896_02475, partial [Gammaproteobacteria bacterium]|nr:hypothetical protein [Gammaproteobacteria bacterium]
LDSDPLIVGCSVWALNRLLNAGDDKQLPPVRAVHAQEIDGRRLGGSLYDFLKSAQVAEFPLDETFRLNAPLTSFPETKFYPRLKLPRNNLPLRF